MERKTLTFGTSGLRDTIENMTDMECYINTAGFISFLRERGEIVGEVRVAVGGDLRLSTPRIMAAVIRAIEDEDCGVDLCGHVPTPVLACYALGKGLPSVMVTGSHIPDDRNGIKFAKTSGEVLKEDEIDILRNVEEARHRVNASVSVLFDADGMFVEPRSLPDACAEGEAGGLYVDRYLRVFGADAFEGRKIVLYQHSAVGRDIVERILKDMGADVISVGRSDKFIPVDTEKVSDLTRASFRKWAAEYEPFAIVSTDGDSDRPLVADENGDFIPGDKLGALVSIYLGPDFVAVPVSTNDAVLTALGNIDVSVKLTRIGSPYVVKAMNDELVARPYSLVASWESNGGFLLGSDWTINAEKLKALPTRDAVLPIIATLLLAIREDKAVSDVVSLMLPARYTHADVVDNTIAGCEDYTADMGKEIIKMFSPAEEGVAQIDFTSGGSKRHYEDGRVRETPAGSDAETDAIRARLSRYFGEEKGFAEIVSVNFIDGIKVIFINGDVSHIRPSGNAPEFRNYATASSQKRADELVRKRLEILPEIVKDLTEKVAPRSLGAASAGDPGGTDRALASVRNGVPVQIFPYCEPKVWGVKGIGEYWYGAEAGEKSSTAVIGDDRISLEKVVGEATEDVLGKEVVEKFGPALPLVKILTPKGRLSVQFHDAKNELWIVTAADREMAGGEPCVIVGFSRKVIDLYGGELLSEFRKALEKYGGALNSLIDMMEAEGYGDALNETRDVALAAERVRGRDAGIDEARKVLSTAGDELDKFYHYLPVGVGDVIPIPSGTLHALGAGIEVVEPQIAGPTQSLEDGTTYPVRYYFPGHKREGAKKVLDIERVVEMGSEFTEGSAPEILEDTSSVKVEKLPGNFEDKGLEVHRIRLDAGAELEMSGIKSFHTLVSVGGKAKIITNGHEYDVPPAVAGQEMLIVPASAGSYTLKAESAATVIDTFTPVE